MLLNGFNSLLDWVAFGLLLLKVAAFADALIRPAPVFEAAGKQKKNFWLLILGITAFADLIGFSSFIGLISIIGVIAALVYFFDVRPAVKEIGRPGRSGGWPDGRW